MYGNPRIWGCVVLTPVGVQTAPGGGLESASDVWGSKGRVLETQGFPVLSFGDPLRQIVWPIGSCLLASPPRNLTLVLDQNWPWGSLRIRYWLLILLCWENT